LPLAPDPTGQAKHQQARQGKEAELFELNECFVKHPSNQRLAKVVIYTKDRTPEVICDELVHKLEVLDTDHPL
jgi:hypothetical protein